MRIRRTKRLNRLGKELIRERILLDRRDLLEIGCGKALMLSELASRERGRNFIGVERETEIILKAANFLATKKLKNVSLIRADITKIGERLRGRCNLI